MKKKVLIGFVITLFFITACSSTNPKTYPSLDLPYKVVNEEVEEAKKEGLKDYKDFQRLEKVITRKLTNKENETFIKKMQGNSLNDLNAEYAAVEFDFGNTERIDLSNKTIYKFDEEVSRFIYDDKIIEDEIYQVLENKTKKLLLKKDKDDEEVIYGEKVNNFKIITIVKKDFIKKGLQFKTIINNEIVYVDIK